MSSNFPLAATQLPELNPNYKNENVHKVQTAQKSTPKHKTNRITTEVSPWNDQSSYMKLLEGVGGGA